MKHYKDLSENEKDHLLKFPAYISLLASTADDGIDEEEKRTAINLTHIKTFSCDPLLSDFYKEAESIFEKTVISLNNELPHTKKERTVAICHELDKLEPLLKKLDPEYATVLRNSMESYKHYISRAHRNILEYFIFPMPVNGLTD